MLFFSYNKALKILIITNGLFLIAGRMIGPIYAIFVEKIGGDIFDAGLSAGIFSIAAGLTTLFSGKFTDKIKEDELIVALGYFLTGVGYILYIFVNSILSLFLVQILIGLAEAIYSPAFDAVYSKHITKNQAGSEWAGWEFANYLSQAIGTAVGGLIAQLFGFNALFIIMGLLCLTSAVYIYLLPREIL